MDREMLDVGTHEAPAAARVEGIDAALMVALPRLVAEAFAAFKAELPRLVPGLSDAERETLKREEDQRRADRRSG